MIKNNKKELISAGIKKASALAGIKGADKITKEIPVSKEEATEKVKEKANEEVEKAKIKATEKAKDEVKDKAGDALKGLFGR